MANENLVKHIGPLWGASFRAMLKNGIIRRGKKSDGDTHQLGWEVVSGIQPWHFSFENMHYATAEGVVQLAGLTAALRRDTPQLSPFIVFDRISSDWVNAFQLNQITQDHWNDEEPAWCQVRNCYVRPIWRSEIASEKDALLLSRQGLREFNTDAPWRADWEDVVPYVENVLYEALLNVAQHAYDATKTKYVHSAISVTSAAHVLRMTRETDFISIEEVKWFEEQTKNSNFVLEMSVGDFGSGIPQTLYRDAAQKNLEAYEQLISGISSGDRKSTRLNSSH